MWTSHFQGYVWCLKYVIFTWEGAGATCARPSRHCGPTGRHQSGVFNDAHALVPKVTLYSAQRVSTRWKHTHKSAITQSVKKRDAHWKVSTDSFRSCKDYPWNSSINTSGVNAKSGSFTSEQRRNCQPVNVFKRIVYSSYKLSRRKDFWGTKSACMSARCAALSSRTSQPTCARMEIETNENGFAARCRGQLLIHINWKCPPRLLIVNTAYVLALSHSPHQSCLFVCQTYT